MTAHTYDQAFVADFVNYLFGQDKSPTPIYQTMTNGALRVDWSDFKPAWHLQRLPLGRLWIYPEYAASCRRHS